MGLEGCETKKSFVRKKNFFYLYALISHCGGTGLNPKALESKINGKNVVDYGNMTSTELLAELENLIRISEEK